MEKQGDMVRYYNLIRNIKNWTVHFKRKFGFQNVDPIRFRTRNGIVFEVPERLYHEFKEIFFECAYTIGQQKEITECRPVIIDIGANVGFFSIFALSRFPDATIYAYEPIPANFRQLERNCHINADKTIHCYNQAVCRQRGTITIYVDQTDSFSTSATILPGTAGNPTSIEVPCLRLQDIFDDRQIEQCHFLKLDCEGAEYDILYSTPPSYLQRIDQMAIEVHRGKKSGENLTSLRTFLAENGFSLFQFADKPHMLWAHRGPVDAP